MKTRCCKAILLAVVLLLMLAGCSGRTIPEEEQFLLYIGNETGMDIGAIQVEYGLGGEILGSVVGCYADNTPIKPGDSMDFQFLPEDFPKNSDLSRLSLRIQAIDANGNASTAKIPVTISAAYGHSYEICLTGNGVRLIP